MSPTKDITIIGEFTIARYLGRLLTPSYEDLDANLVTQIDDLLDKAASFKLAGDIFECFCRVYQSLLELLLRLVTLIKNSAC